MWERSKRPLQMLLSGQMISRTDGPSSAHRPIVGSVVRACSSDLQENQHNVLLGGVILARFVDMERYFNYLSVGM